MREVYFRAVITIDDLIWSPLYIIIILLFAVFFRNLFYIEGNPLRKYFLPGLIVKMVGAICVGILYVFYYPQGGDTTEFFNNAEVFNNAFIDSPINFWHLLISPAINNDPTIHEYRVWMFFVFDPASFTVGKIAGIVNLLTFNIYTPCALLFAALSYTGIWLLYVTFCKIYPDMHKQFAIAILFVPSVFFWGSGILKDSITLGCVGWITYCSYNMFLRGRNLVLLSLFLLLTTWLIAIIKPYILFAFAPSLLFWIFLNYRSKINSAFVRIISGPIIFAMTMGLGAVVIQRLGREFQQYSFKGVLSTSQGYQDYHGYLSKTGEVGSGYNLGFIDGSFMSIFTRIPAAINVTLFRPYLWEVHNPVMLMSAVESTVILFFTIRIIYQTGIGGTFRSLLKNPTAFFCIFFAMFFGFCVGFTAYNFGALVRYKIPCIPFYATGLYILHRQTLVDLAIKRRKKELRGLHGDRALQKTDI